MSIRADKPKDYFAQLLAASIDDIDYSEAPSTTHADWEDAEVLFPVTAMEFHAIKEFIRARRERALKAPETEAETLP